MAKSNASNARKTATRRGGRKSNAQREQERIQSVQSHAMQLIEVATAAYSQGLKTAFGIDSGVAGTVTTIGAATGSASGQSTAQGQSQNQQSQGQSTSGRKRQAPGRRQDPTSKMTLTREFYAENMKLPADQRLARADLVKAAAKKFGYTPATGNTYISKIDNENGRKLARRRTSSNGRSRGGQSGGQKNGTNG